MDCNSDRFDVYICAMSIDPPIKENSRPLEASDAVKLAVNCTKRVAVSDVRIVCVNNDTIDIHL